MAGRAGDCRIVRMIDAEPEQLTALVRKLARQVGFELVGVSSANELPEAGQRLTQAIEKNYIAGMGYLRQNPAQRARPKAFKPWAKTVISVGINYNTVPLSTTGQAGAGLISRYALGRDYHLVVREKLRKLAAELAKSLSRDFRSCVAVDSSPLMEKPLAQRAGIGWQGKNSLIINKQFGSWIFLGELLTDLEPAVDKPAVNRCGSCRACIEACPTGALSEPGVLDARKCISYLTVEHKGKFSLDMIEKVRTAGKQTGGYLFGCDICQEVCPFNRDRPCSREKEFQPREQLLKLSLEEAGQMSQAQFKELSCGTALGRLSFEQFRRNVRAVK